MVANLPLEKSSFVGRQRLLDVLQERIARPDTRLLTLTGSGGTGKTRLAVRAASVAAEKFRDGAVFVGLATINDPDVVLPTIGRALGVKQAAGKRMLAALQEHLRAAELLLVLDNFEQVLPAAQAIADLIAACRTLKVVATSRELLRLSGEQEVPVPPLAVPGGQETGLEQLETNEAVALFLERARAARPDFALTEANASAVVQVCRRLDGLPLALELAAARLRALPLPALLQRLERRLPLLTGGPRDAPARQQTLADTIGWSYDLLTPAEQVLFARLGVFRGCTLDAVEEVCCASAEGPGTSSLAAAPPGIDALAGVTSLLEKSLLRREETEDGEPWYLMLETVREFALDRLAASGDEAAIRRRQALRLLRFVEEADQQLHGPAQAKLFARLEREHDDLRETLAWCEARGYAEPALRIATALWWFWVVRGYAAEGLRILRSLLDRFPSRGNASRDRLLVRAHEAAGHLAAFQGDMEAALTYHHQNLHVVKQLDDRMGLYRTLQNLGFVSRQRGQWDAARDYFQRCLEVARGSAGPAEIGYAFYNLGSLAHDEGRYEDARALLAQSLPLLEETGDPRQIGNVYLSLGIVASDCGDYEEARVQMEKGVELWQQSGDRRAVAAVAWMNLASVAIAQGRFDEALQRLTASVHIAQEFGDIAGVAGVLERFAWYLLARDQAADALRIAGAAAAVREAKGARLPPAAQHKLEAGLAPAWSRLSPADAAAAYALGRGLTASEAVAELLRAAAAPAHGSQTGEQAANEQPATPLTSRELEIAALVASGATNRQIAEALVITEGTAANHVLHILNKLGFDSRTQIAVWAVHQGLPLHLSTFLSGSR